MYNLTIDRRKKVDVPTQLVDSLKENISTKKQVHDTKMWSIDEFAQKYDITQEQAVWVYQQLLESNYIHEEKNAYYVEDFEIPVISFNRMHSIQEIIVLNRLKPSFKDLKASVVKRPDELKDHFNDADHPFFKIERIYYGDMKPMIYTVHYFDLEHFSGLNHKYEENSEIWKILVNDYHAQREYNKLRFKGKMLTKEEMALFDTKNPLSNYLESFIFEKDHSLFEYTQICILADTLRYRLEYDL